MKNTFAKIASVAAIALALVQTSQAAFITGNIGFSGLAVYDTGSVDTATKVISWVTPVVSGTTGSFSGIGNNTPVNFAPMWSFNSPTGINPFWSVGGFTFQLLSSVITAQKGDGFLSVVGTGIVSAKGYQDTALNWRFSTQDPALGNNQFSFSASSNSVPDGGATVALLGLALSGVGLLRKKLTA
jgi:hypothetical protein